ncbi:hypothetical protein [Parasitella parasitica]|uniref:Uncharacterized protein n=1 Tax=Parasitella parasitica TaxID=35722 RepID=A0A0B7NE97_9FUNG|nr:hypothetical protein [Parasitella parasitica]
MYSISGFLGPIILRFYYGERKYDVRNIYKIPQPQIAGSISIVSSHQDASGNTKNNKLINIPLCQDPKAPKNKQVALDAHSSSALYSSNHSKGGALCNAHDNSFLQAQESNYAASQIWSSAASTSSAKDRKHALNNAFRILGNTKTPIKDSKAASNAFVGPVSKTKKRLAAAVEDADDNQGSPGTSSGSPLRYEPKKKLCTNTNPQQLAVNTVNTQETHAVYTKQTAIQDNKEDPPRRRAHSKIQQFQSISAVESPVCWALCHLSVHCAAPNLAIFDHQK